MSKSFNMDICRRYCPYLDGRKPVFAMTKMLHEGYLAVCCHPVNGEGMHPCVMVKKNAPFMSGKELSEWMGQNVDVATDLMQCPCKCEHCIMTGN